MAEGKQPSGEHPERTEINELGEFGLIEHLTRRVQLRNRSSSKGVGDDAAVMNHDGQATLLSTELLVEGIDFDLVYTPLKHLGYKAVIVTLSDIYAMNARPRQLTFSMALSNRFSVEALDELYAGVLLACDQYGVDLVGGDTTSSRKGLVISVSALGSGDAEKLTYRHTAKVGDVICISGNLGAAYLGLQILEREKKIYLDDPNVQPDFEEKSYLLERQLKPEARRDMIEVFEKSQLLPTAMMDISDGLASELFHLCRQSKVGAFIEESGIPIHPDAQTQALEFKLDPVTCALSGGEDYELLFTVDPQDLEKVKYLPDIYIAGEIVEASEGLKLHTVKGRLHNITAPGWKHFDPNRGANDL